MEIYRTPLSPMFLHKRFDEVANIIYDRFGAILVGMETSTTSEQLLRTGSFVKTMSPGEADTVQFSQLLMATMDYV